MVLLSSGEPERKNMIHDLLKFYSKEHRKFEPPPSPKTPRKWSGGTIHRQDQSTFFTQLPAEIRNKIYRHVFLSASIWQYSKEIDKKRAAELGVTKGKSKSTNDPDTPTEPRKTKGKSPVIKKQPHPLSLLLTCRLVNQEATGLAFNTYAFSAAYPLYTYHALQHASSGLSPIQKTSISALAYNIDMIFHPSSDHAASFVANALSLFAGLRYIELRVLRATTDQSPTFHWQDYELDAPAYAGYTPASRRAPRWVHSVLWNVVTGREYAWQKGEKWRVEWPHETSGVGAFIDGIFTDVGGQAAEEAMDGVEGIELCACCCGAPAWLIADLVQETGRVARLQVEYSGDSTLRRMDELANHDVQLVPGVEPLQVTRMPGGGARTGGFGWDGLRDVGNGLTWRRSGGVFGRLTERFTPNGVVEQVPVDEGELVVASGSGETGEADEPEETVAETKHTLQLSPGAEPLQVTRMPGGGSRTGGFGWDGTRDFGNELKWRWNGIFGKLREGFMGNGPVEQVPVDEAELGVGRRSGETGEASKPKETSQETSEEMLQDRPEQVSDEKSEERRKVQETQETDQSRPSLPHTPSNAEP